MTDSTPASTPHPTGTNWLYRTLAFTGIAVGLFVIGAGLYLLFGHPGTAHSAQQDCCKSMEGDMKKMMDELAKDMPVDEITEAMIPAYQAHFTHADIEAEITALRRNRIPSLPAG